MCKQNFEMFENQMLKSSNSNRRRVAAEEILIVLYLPPVGLNERKKVNGKREKEKPFPVQ